MIQLTPMDSRAKNKWYKIKKVKKLALNLQLLSVQILTNDVQVLILCTSHFITTVLSQYILCFIVDIVRVTREARVSKLLTLNFWRIDGR